MEYESLYRSLGSQCRECQVVTGLTGNEIELSSVFNFDSQYPGFKGHFPERPVLPAIVQLAAVRYTAEQGLEETFYPVSYSRVKFRGIIQPEETVKVHLKLINSAPSWEGNFSLQKHEIKTELIASGSCVFIPTSAVSKRA